MTGASERLLRRCASPARDPAGLEAIRTAAAEVGDWDEALLQARRHGVHGLVRSALREAQVDAPPDARAALDHDHVARSRRALTVSAETARLVRALRGADIPALPLKGPVLAHLAYGD